MFGLGTTELIVILVIIAIFFGAKKLPELGEGIGKALKNFKKATDEEPKDKKKDNDDSSD